MRSRSLISVGILSMLVLGLVAGSWAQGINEDVRSSPKDTTPYVREAVPEDYAPEGFLGAFPPAIFIVDTVVNNTDPTLTNTDTANDGETSIAINPANPDEIVISTFAGGWGTDAPIWHTIDGGITWTKSFTIPHPPGMPFSCPCDQAFDYGRNNELSGTFLVVDPTLLDNNFDVVSGTTTNPANDTFWNWLTSGTPPVTQLTNHLTASSIGNADQPWLLVNRDPTNATQDNVYGAYDDFSGGPNMRVAVSYGLNPPNFTVDNQSGTSTGFVNPGHRLAKDPRTGYMYSLFQRRIAPGAGGSQNIDYMLNRSTDGGATWTLNGNANGIIVANADSTQPTPKFGTVNALLGGVDHAAVDPNTGDIYYVYGNRDSGTGNNRLAIRRIVGDGSGNVIVGSENFVTGQAQAAIPSVAVTSDGTVGVFYYTFDGFSSDGFPIFTAYLALSTDKGATFTTQRLLTFLSSAKDNGDSRQRVLGDYMQMKAVENCFYGAFTGNGVPFGRPFANHDPIFFSTCLGPTINVPSSVALGDACVGSTASGTLDVCDTGDAALIVQTITSNNSQFTVATPSSGYPVTVSPDFCFPFEVRFTPTSTGPKSATLTIPSNDPANPSITVQATGNGVQRKIAVTGSTEFGNVCSGSGAEKTVSVCNTGACDLHVSSASFIPACPDFTLINNPFPATVSHNSCLNLVIQFTPTSDGLKSCNLVITSDDPTNSSVTLTVTGDTAIASIDVPPDLGFPATVIQSIGACSSQLAFPISNTGSCNLKITTVAITADTTEYSLSGLPSFPIILEPGHVAGSGALNTVFAPRVLGRSDSGTLTVTYETDPITHATASVTRALCGEGVRTGARVLVTAGGVPVQKVERIHLQRINANRNKNILKTVDNAKDLSLVSITQTAPCASFQYHREYGTVSNPIQLLPGSYQVTATAIVNGKRTSKTVGFDVTTCGFNPNIVINF